MKVALRKKQKLEFHKLLKSLIAFIFKIGVLVNLTSIVI